MVVPVMSAILEGLEYVPKFVQAGKDAWKNLKEPMKLAAVGAPKGVKGNTYYSGEYKFQISVPDDNWVFWEPTDRYINSLGPAYALPNRAVPIMIMSKNMVKLVRPVVTVTVEDVGSFTNVQELVAYARAMAPTSGFSVSDENVKISPNTNSAALIATQRNPMLGITVYVVQQIFLYPSKQYIIWAQYVPIDDKSPQLFGGMQDIMNSFKLIKE